MPRLEGPGDLSGSLKPTYHKPRKRRKERPERDWIRLPNGKWIRRVSRGGSYGPS